MPNVVLPDDATFKVYSGARAPIVGVTSVTPVISQPSDINPDDLVVMLAVTTYVGSGGGTGAYPMSN